MLELNNFLPLSQRDYKWTFFGADHKGLPNVEYVLYEYYCDKAGCTCEHVKTYIAQLDKQGELVPETLAVIDYDLAQSTTKREPVLAPESPQNSLTPHFLAVYTGMVRNGDYVARLKRHYAQVKKMIAERVTAGDPIPTHNTRYNDPCICGGNKTYEKCCLYE